MGQSAECRTRLISDVPATEDAFGPHDRVAAAIADLVVSEDGGKTIGMEGRWGFGKSTVVNLLKKKLQAKPGIALWSFDAWAHEGDPLRRTFLESLISQLIGRSWINKHVWEERRDELARRRKVTSSRTIPQLEAAGKLLIFFVFLVPFGYAFLRWAMDKDDPALFGLGAFFILAPLGLLVGPLVLNAAFRLSSRKKESKPTDDTAMWTLFTGKTVTENRSETTENPDPTSVEFETTFTALMNEALSVPERRLILVLDNLDRVDPDDALAIWSTLQTFLSHRLDNRFVWLDRMWVVIPHDPTGIRRLWERTPDGEGVASSFLDKSFQVTFEVPPPVLSDWREYLQEQLRIGLPDHAEDEFHLTYRVYAVAATKSGASPTPRDLKVYVNDIGAIHRQWQDHFPLAHVGYYVILRRTKSSVADELLEGRVPEPELLGLLGAEIRDNLAALAFNVEVPLARQILLRDPIQNALSRGDGEELKSIAGNHPEGFWEVIETSVAEGSALFGDPATLASAGRALDESQVLSQQVRPEARSVIQAVRNAVDRTGAWIPFNEPVAQGILSISHILNSTPDMANKMLDAISAGDSADQGGVAPDEWVDGFVVLARGFTELGLFNDESPAISVGGNAPIWITVCIRLDQLDPGGDTWMHLTPRVSVADLASSMAEATGNGQFAEGYLSVIRITAVVGGKPSWEPLASAINVRLQAPNAIPGSEMARLLEALWILRPVDPSAESTLGQLAGGGHVLHHLYQAVTDNEVRAVAWCFLTFVDLVPSADLPAAIGNSQAGYDQFTQIITTPDSHAEFVPVLRDLLVRLDRRELLFKLLDVKPAATPLVLAVISDAVEHREGANLVTPPIFEERWPLLAENLSEDAFNDLVKQLIAVDRSAYARQGEFDPVDGRLYLAWASAGLVDERDFQDWCAAGLKAVSRQDWLKELKAGGYLVRLLLNLVEHDMDLELGLEYQDALVDHAKTTLSAKSISKALRGRSDALLVPLSATARSIVRRGLYDAAAGVDGNIGPGFIEAYGREVFRAERLRETRDAPYRLFTPILSKRNAPALSRVADVLETDSALMDAFDRDTVEDFKLRLQEALAEDADDASPAIDRIARMLKVEPTEDSGTQVFGDTDEAQ